MRNARGGDRPDVPRLARVCVRAGAVGVTLHPRPDGRHARAADVAALAALVGEGFELNVEGNPFEGPGRTGGYAFPGFMELVRRARPTQATLVPDAAGQRTSDHGWDLARDGAALAPLIREIGELGCRVSLFLDPEPAAVRAAADLGADRVELYTGPYACAHAAGDARAELDRHRAAADQARLSGVTVNAGHDLDQTNLGAYLGAVPGVAEVSIGQALLADALEHGLAATVAAYLEVIRQAPS